MLSERNENTKTKIVPQSKILFSPKKIEKIFKENKLQFNTKELLLKSSKLYTSEPPSSDLDFIACETNKIRNFNLRNIINNELDKCPLKLRANFLKPHLLTPEIRARMVFLLGRLDDRSAQQLQLYFQHFLPFCRYHGQLP